MSNKVLEAEKFHIERKEVLYIKGDVLTIKNGTAKPVLIIAHGFRGHKDWGFWPDAANRFAENGFYTVIFNFSRIGAQQDGLDESITASASTLSAELSDWEAVVAAFLDQQLPLSQEADRNKLTILGHSRSGGSGILFASEQTNVRSLVVWNGGGTPNRPSAADGEPLSQREQAILEDLKRNEQRFDVPGRFGQLQIPALIVQGDQDNERLLARNRELKDIAPHQHFVTVSGGNHTFNTEDPYKGSTRQLDEAIEETVNFLKSVFSEQ